MIPALVVTGPCSCGGEASFVGTTLARAAKNRIAPKHGICFKFYGNWKRPVFVLFYIDI
jgi:hypothetical protein